MGWIRDTKADVLGEEAKYVRNAGGEVFVAVLNEPKTRVGWTGEVKDWTAAVAAVEAQGWRLEHWTTTTDPKGQPQAYPVFRRTEA